MKKRWLIYIIIGVLFGVFDFYYQQFTGGIVTSFGMWFVVAWGIWLVPIIPIVLYEAKVSESRVKPVLANVLTYRTNINAIFTYIPLQR